MRSSPAIIECSPEFGSRAARFALFRPGRKRAAISLGNSAATSGTVVRNTVGGALIRVDRAHSGRRQAWKPCRSVAKKSGGVFISGRLPGIQLSVLRSAGPEVPGDYVGPCVVDGDGLHNLLRRECQDVSLEMSRVLCLRELDDHLDVSRLTSEGSHETLGPFAPRDEPTEPFASSRWLTIETGIPPRDTCRCGRPARLLPGSASGLHRPGVVGAGPDSPARSRSRTNKLYQGFWGRFTSRLFESPPVTTGLAWHYRWGGGL